MISSYNQMESPQIFEIHLSFWDRLRILFGAHIRFEISQGVHKVKIIPEWIWSPENIGSVKGIDWGMPNRDTYAVQLGLVEHYELHVRPADMPIDPTVQRFLAGRVGEFMQAGVEAEFKKAFLNRWGDGPAQEDPSLFTGVYKADGIGNPMGAHSESDMNQSYDCSICGFPVLSNGCLHSYNNLTESEWLALVPHGKNNAMLHRFDGHVINRWRLKWESLSAEQRSSIENAIQSKQETTKE